MDSFVFYLPQDRRKGYLGASVPGLREIGEYLQLVDLVLFRDSYRLEVKHHAFQGSVLMPMDLGIDIRMV